MGLDITAYRQLKPAPDAEVDSDGYPVEWDKYLRLSPAILKFTDENWPGRTAPLVPGIYSFADSLGFRAGSYSGYGQWRDWLARAAGYQSARDVWENVVEGPFVELINFADTEGTIGTVACAKLARDFAEHEDRILASADGWNAKLYKTWRAAFEMAADGGCVDFH